jgi:hypothetical protein
MMATAARQSVEVLYDVTRDELETRGHKAEEDLEESLYTTVDIEQYNAGVVAALHTDDIAASVLEYGAVPADNEAEMVNADSIELWLEAKGIVPEIGSQKQYAWAIAKKIGREGQDPSKRHTSPGRPFNNAQRKAKRRVERIWDDAVENLMRGLNSG